MEKIAILGFGCAGYHCAKTLREEGFEGAIHVCSDTDLPPYNPMLTTYYAGHRLPWEALFPFGPLKSIAQSLSLDVHCRAKVRRLDAARREVILDSGERDQYDAVLIATGARAFVPPLPHMPDRDVYVMRTPADAEALRQRLDRGDVRSAVVVGASMVGIKIAELFQRAGIHCVLTDQAPTLFPLAAVPEVGRELGRRVEEKGVCLHLGQRLTDLRESGGRLEVCLERETLPADVVVLAIGTRPDLDFLDADGPRVDRGVLVDRHMETSVPGIYAAGDCASALNIQSGQDQIIGLWANAGYQGVTAAGAMLGKGVHYPGSLQHNITHFLDVDLFSCGDIQAQGEVLRYSNDGFYLYAVRREGKLALVNIVGDHIISGIIKNHMTRCFQGHDGLFSPMQRVILLRNGLSQPVIDLLERGALKGGPTCG